MGADNECGGFDPAKHYSELLKQARESKSAATTSSWKMLWRRLRRRWPKSVHRSKATSNNNDINDTANCENQATDQASSGNISYHSANSIAVLALGTGPRPCKRSKSGTVYSNNYYNYYNNNANSTARDQNLLIYYSCLSPPHVSSSGCMPIKRLGHSGPLFCCGASRTSDFPNAPTSLNIHHSIPYHQLNAHVPSSAITTRPLPLYIVS